MVYTNRALAKRGLMHFRDPWLQTRGPLIVSPSCQTADLKVALQIMGRTFYENTKGASLYPKSLLIFIHKIPVVENHPTTGEIREFLWPRSTPAENTVYFYMSSSVLYILEIQKKKVSIIASDEDIMENNYMFVILWNLNVINHLIFP